MRKLIFVVLASLIAFAFSPKNSPNKKRETVPKILVALNGYTESQANARVTLLAGSVDNVPENTQVWFSKDIIKAWRDLLITGDEKNKADGIRIYFSRCLPSPNNPIHDNNGVIVVSTSFSPIKINNKDTLVHLDYFDHAASYELFKNLDSIHGEVKHYGDTSAGTLLYATCNNCDRVKPCNIVSDHQISRSKGERMVQDFHRKIFHKGSINSTCEWFNKEILEYWLAEMADDTIKGIKYDGIRIYFSRGQRNEAYLKNETRFVFVPTKSRDGDHVDVIDCDPANKDRFDYYLTYKNKERALNDPGVTDNGELCPNHCPGSTLPQP